MAEADPLHFLNLPVEIVTLVTNNLPIADLVSLLRVAKELTTKLQADGGCRYISVPADATKKVVLFGVEVVKKVAEPLMPFSFVLRFPHLRVLSFPQNTKFTDEDISLLPRGLKYLDLRLNRLITDQGVRALPQSLQFLNLWGSVNITEASIPFLPRTLQYLDVCRASANFSAKALDDLPPNLVHLNVFHFKLFTNENVKKLPYSLRRLEFQPEANEGLDRKAAPNFPPALRDNKQFISSLNDYVLPSTKRGPVGGAQLGAAPNPFVFGGGQFQFQPAQPNLQLPFGFGAPIAQPVQNPFGGAPNPDDNDPDLAAAIALSRQEQ